MSFILNSNLDSQSKDITFIETEKLCKITSSSSLAIPDKNNVHLVKKFAFVVCREFLGGIWKGIDYSDFLVERMS